ncbi:peptidase M50 [Methanocaldococcus infernus ME]|uniref:Peptidase M50 n=1 Tax=Methanocaldococcus infernus (strain DSM 11812 / JCM 15783 / ME) TaxID=573063 RepID=D5VSE6_METIM|nr:site-2 protease family protein [Methanocaldococcus infernus]ADG13499.1 peptidase M50 [Methanocaldococcus infernus ME]
MKYLILIFIILWLVLYTVREKTNLKVYYGIFGILRTKLGFGIIEKLGKYKFWRKIGILSIPICSILGIFMLINLTIMSVNLALGHVSKEEAKPVIFLFGTLIPWIPGLIGLIVAITIHELAHGIFAKSFNIKIKSSGVIFLLGIPLGAFVELDDKFKEVDKKIRGAIASAGPLANLFIYLLASLLIVLANFAPTNLEILDVKEPASKYLKKGDIILKINDMKINNLEDFKSVAKQIEPNKIYKITVLRDNKVLEFNIKSSDLGRLGILVAPTNKGLVEAINILYWTSFFNFILALFNLIPAKPLDGYYVLTALPELVKERSYRLGEFLERVLDDKVINSITLLVWWIIIGSIIYSML